MNSKSIADKEMNLEIKDGVDAKEVGLDRTWQLNLGDMKDATSGDVLGLKDK